MRWARRGCCEDRYDGQSLRRVLSPRASGRHAAVLPNFPQTHGQAQRVESGMLSRMCSSVSVGFVVSWAVIVVSRIRVPGSSDALLEAQPAAAALTSPTRIMCRMQSLLCTCRRTAAARPRSPPPNISRIMAPGIDTPFLRSPCLDRLVAAPRAGNSRPAGGPTAPELEVVPREHPAAQTEAGAGSQQVLGEHLLGEIIRVFPAPRLKTWIEGGILWAEPRLPAGCVRHARIPLPGQRGHGS